MAETVLNFKFTCRDQNGFTILVRPADLTVLRYHKRYRRAPNKKASTHLHDAYKLLQALWVAHQGKHLGQLRGACARISKEQPSDLNTLLKVYIALHGRGHLCAGFVTQQFTLHQKQQPSLGQDFLSPACAVQLHILTPPPHPGRHTRHLSTQNDVGKLTFIVIVIIIEM